MTATRQYLKDIKPHLETEYVTELNPKPFSSLAPTSIMNVHWRCQNCGHEWETTVLSRTRGSGCPVCTQARGRGGLAKAHPHLEAEYMTDPTLNPVPFGELARSSSRKVWWRCQDCGHEWDTRVSIRAAGSGCPECARMSRRHRATLYAVQQPELRDQYMHDKNVIPFDELRRSESEYVWWQCQRCGHQWQTRAHSRRAGSGCPICSRVRKSSNFLERSNPELRKDYDFGRNDRPFEGLSRGSNYLAWWECRTCRHKWQAFVFNRANGTGCPNCAGRVRTPLVAEPKPVANLLSVTNPELREEYVTELNDLPFDELTKGMNRHVVWRCATCGHQWSAFVYNRAMGKGCPECLQQRMRDDIIEPPAEVDNLYFPPEPVPVPAQVSPDPQPVQTEPHLPNTVPANPSADLMF